MGKYAALRNDSFWYHCAIVEEAIENGDINLLSYEAYKSLREPFSNAESHAQEMAQKEMLRLSKLGIKLDHGCEYHKLESKILIKCRRCGKKGKK